MSKITRKGQVTIPESIRESLGLLPGCEVEFIIEKGKLILRRDMKRAKLEKWQGTIHLDGEVDEFIDSLRAGKKQGKKRA